MLDDGAAAAPKSDNQLISAEQRKRILEWPIRGRVTIFWILRLARRPRISQASLPLVTQSGQRRDRNPAVQQVSRWRVVLCGAGPAAPKLIQNNSGLTQGLAIHSGAGSTAGGPRGRRVRS